MAADLRFSITGVDAGSQAVADAIQQHFKGAFEDIRVDLRDLNATFTEVGDQIAEQMKATGEKISESLSAKAEASGGGLIAGLAGGPVGLIASGLLKGITFVGGIVWNVVSGVGGIVLDALSSVPGIVIGVFEGAFNAVKTLAGVAFDGVSYVIGAAFDGLGAVLDLVVLTPFRLIFNKVTALAGGIGLAWGAKVAADVQDSLSIALALVPDRVTPAFRQSMLEALEELRAETGAKGDVIGRTLYNAISAGAKDSPEILTEASLKFAVLGGQAEAADTSLALFAQTANALGKELKDSLAIADLYQKTIQEGILRPQDLANQVGKVLPFVQSMKLQMGEVLGIVAQASKTFTSEQLFTGFQGFLARLLDPAAIALAREQLGVELYNLEGEFVGVFEALRRLSEAGPSGEILDKLFPDVSALKFFQTLREQIEETKAAIATVSDSAGAIDAAWAERSRSISLQTSRLVGQIGNLFSELFSVVEDDLRTAIEYGVDITGNLVTKLRELKDEGRFAELRTEAGEAWNTFKSWLPTLEEIRSGFHSVLTTGVTAFEFVRREAGAVKSIFTDLFSGRDVDLSQSNLVLGGQIAFEHIKRAGADAFNWIREKAGQIFDSETARIVLDDAGILLGVTSDLFSTVFANIKNKITQEILAGIVGAFESIAKYFPANFVTKLFGLDLSEPFRNLRREIEQIGETTRQQSWDIYVSNAEIALKKLESPIKVPNIEVNEGRLNELEARFAANLDAMRDKAETTATEIETALGKIGAPVVAAVQEVLQVRPKEEPVVVDHSAEISALQQNIDAATAALRERERESRELYKSQGEAVKETGRYDAEVTAAIAAKKAEIAGIKASIAEASDQIRALEADQGRPAREAQARSEGQRELLQLQAEIRVAKLRIEDLRTAGKDLMREQGEHVRQTGEYDDIVAGQYEATREEIREQLEEIRAAEDRIRAIKEAPAEVLPPTAAPAPVAPPAAAAAAPEPIEIPEMPEVESTREDREAIKTALATSRDNVVELKDVIEDLATEQVRFATEHGDLSSQIVARLRDLAAQLAGERSRVLQLEASLAR